MSDWREALYLACAGVLKGDRSMIGQLRDAGFECCEAAWSFRLPTLHQWLAGQTDTAAYAVFLKQLYAGDLNARLAALGGHIVIAEQRGKVSESLYRLQRRP